MKAKGFTLIEMVMTIIVGAILVLGIAGFIQLGASGYSDTVERQRIQTQAKFLIEKISREVRHAVPNMLDDLITLTGADSCVNFYPILSSGFYAISGDDIQFIVGQEGVTVADITGLNFVINPTEATPTNNNFALTGVTSSNDTFLLPGQAAAITGHSVSNRHYIFDQSNRVSYCLMNGQVVRFDGNNRVIPISDMGVSGQLSYVPATVQRNGIVHLNLAFSNQQGDESTNYQQDVQVLNVP
ncbi:PilW family protein [Vibrio maerlii]|uniref:PilW family protein n=1 Tax=Vibrio maerlii TaxID=2231648 RepID=UPI000E3BF670|nr:prepilin-type N-terminal cleavage/methylation domain-containing protein [Vibrio maerlii]